jgi:hypothetical protein
MGPQFRPARAMLGWTTHALTRRAVVRIATINAIEETNLPSSRLIGEMIMSSDQDFVLAVKDIMQPCRVNVYIARKGCGPVK